MFGYSIYDKKAGLYHPPMFMQHEVQAVRAVQHSASSPDNQLAKYPDDFALVCVCEFNESTGEMSSFNKLIAQVASLVEGKKS